MMVVCLFAENEEELQRVVVDFNTSYRVSVPTVRCQIVLGEKMEEVSIQKVLYKHGNMEREIIGIVEKGTCVIWSLARIKRERNVSMEVNKGSRNSILLSILTYGSDLDMEYGTSFKNACCGNELFWRSMWHDKMEE